MTAIAARLLPQRRNHDTPPAFLAALIMHAALVGWMWFAVQWRTNASPPAVAELWQLAPLAEPAVEPPAPPVAPIPPPPSEQPTPPKADIVQKQEAPRKPVEAPRKETPAKKDNKAKQTPTREEVRRQQALAEKQHQQEMARLTQQAGVVSRNPAPASIGPISNEYSAKIIAAVRAKLIFPVPEGVSPSVYAEFEVALLPTGEQAAEPRLVKPSGLPGFDEAARRAILGTDPFPRRDDGTVPRTLSLKLYPQDAR